MRHKRLAQEIHYMQQEINEGKKGVVSAAYLDLAPAALPLLLVLFHSLHWDL